MKPVKSILSSLLAFLVLMSSTTFMVGVHICSGEIQNIALFSKAEGCEKEKSLPPCHRHETPACCQDETVVHSGDDEQLSASKVQVAALISVDVESPMLLVSEIVPTTPVALFQYSDYDPPLRTCDLTVEHLSFLI